MFYFTILLITIFYFFSCLIYFKFFKESSWYKRLLTVLTVFFIHAMGAFLVFSYDVSVLFKIGTLFTLFYGPLLCYLFQGLSRGVLLQFFVLIIILFSYLIAMLLLVASPSKDGSSFMMLNKGLRIFSSVINLGYAVVAYLYLLNRKVGFRQRFLSYFYICILFSTAFMSFVFFLDKEALYFERPFFMVQTFLFFIVAVFYLFKDLINIFKERKVFNNTIVGEEKTCDEACLLEEKAGCIVRSNDVICVDVRSVIIREIIDKKAFLDPNLTIGKLSEHTQLALPELRNFFSHTEEGSYNSYINRIRIEYSLIILSNIKEENKTIDQWAVECGFNSRVSFYRSFKKVMGFAPSELLH